MSAAETRERSADFPRTGEFEELRTGANFSLARVGRPENLLRYAVRHPATGETVRGKVFLKEALDLCGMELSFGNLPPGAGTPFLHRHRENEEVYLFLSGIGQMQVDGETVAISAGTAVRVAPAGVRAWRNTSAEEMFYIVVQAKAGSLSHWTGSDGELIPGAPVWPDAA
jgi:quercetin dioxygenase-like cupin family protein